MSDPFSTGAMANALPVANGGAAGSGDQEEKQWTEKTAFDYEAMTKAPDDQQWDGNARVYEWNEEYGDVGPEAPELEIDLFGPLAERKERTGLDFSTIDRIEVTQEGPTQITPIKSFDDAGLHPIMIANIRLAGYDAPTPIQKYTIPSLVKGHDVIGVAQTGSGKTGAYLIPIISKLMGKAKKLAAARPNPGTFREGLDEVVAEPLVMIVVPTRELAVQVFNEARKFCYRSMLRPCCIYGGTPVRQQMALLNRGCDVLVATPGRLADFIFRPNVLTLRRLKYTVLDEADELLNDDWHENMQAILQGGEQDVGNVKFCLFSATFPKAARDLAKQYLTANHVRFRVGRAGSTHANIQQTIVQVEPHEKRGRLLELLGEFPGVRTIIFVNSRQGCDNTDDFLFNAGLPVTSIHSDRNQVEREAAMRAFRSGKAPILIATGVSARGIHVDRVMHIVNMDLPSMEHGGIEEYTHRIGRTGRIGNRGVATSFFTERDEPIADVLTRFLCETDQVIPEFLEQYAPTGEARQHLKFETESDFGEDDGPGAAGDSAGENAGGGWGAGDAGATADAGGDGGWGGGGDAVQEPAPAGW